MFLGYIYFYIFLYKRLSSTKDIGNENIQYKEQLLMVAANIQFCLDKGSVVDVD